MKKGNITIDPLILIPLVLVVVGLSIFFIGKQLGVTPLDYLPSYGQGKTVLDGETIVGIELKNIDPVEISPAKYKEGAGIPLWGTSRTLEKPAEHNYPANYFRGIVNLSYYSGEKFNMLKVKNFQTSNKEIDAEEIRDGLAEFYFLTDRKGDTNFDLSSGAKLQIEERFEGKGRVPFSYTLNKRDMYWLGLNDEVYKDAFSNSKASLSDGDAISAVIRWRNQILISQRCEKFITLSFTEEGSDITRSYLVKKYRNFIYVDLDADVGGAEKYDTC